MTTDTVCFVCGLDSQGYGQTLDGHRICYKCCANQDREEMRRDGRITLYLTGVAPLGKDVSWIIDPRWKIANWPGSLEFRPMGQNVKVGCHNMAGVRYDTWFVFEGYVWHGVSFGDNSELLYCHRTKQPDPNLPIPRKHYIGLAGLHGYMPNYNTCAYDTRGQCADDLGSLHELSGRQIKQMRRDQYFELDLHIHGNEYCEINVCDCGGNSDNCPANEPM